MPLFIGLASLGFLYLLNIFAIIVQSSMLCSDRNFSSWINTTSNKVFYIFASLISLIINHKFRNIIFSRLFTFSVFSSQMDSVHKFKIFNIFSFLSLLHSGGAIFAVSVAIKNVSPNTQLYYECIDVIIVTSMNVIMAFTNALKGDEFFHE
eukprot:GHVR01001093.1.p1 GENE.GHVR01001093.1~~GHVR01001093.1.p1  ORF type:complete len:151 (+),score=4.51 GHVR01001093.1:2740-3192(+)